MHYKVSYDDLLYVRVRHWPFSKYVHKPEVHKIVLPYDLDWKCIIKFPKMIYSMLELDIGHFQSMYIKFRLLAFQNCKDFPQKMIFW